MAKEEWFRSGVTGLLTDQYEITMAACYFDRAMHDRATFSLFVRKLPRDRSFLLAAGLEEVLDYLENLRFSGEAIDYLRGTGLFGESFLEFLSGMRFTGDVLAVPEGTVIFPNEPLLEVTAPIAEAQIVETYLLNAIQLQTLIATKAARVLSAARGRGVVDFASRRTHGRDSSLKVARASYLAGFSATSNVLAGKMYGIPVAGTLAHSFVQAFENEIDSFRAFARVFPDNTTLLIDTYDTIEGAGKAVQIGQEMAREGKALRGVRLDSGDVVHLAKEVRQILDAGGLDKTQIFVSGSLDEFKIDDALSQDAPVDAFGVGSALGTSSDAPTMDIVYKLVAYGDRPVLKLSQGKQTLAGPKQVFRRFTKAGEMKEDVLALREETIRDAQPLLVEVMKNGKRIESSPSLKTLRARVETALASLPPALRVLRGSAPYSVSASPALEELQSRLVDEHGGMVERSG